MNISLCTITFRHHLLSIDDIAAWARDHGFQGIELWGAHAHNLAGRQERNADWLAEFGLTVPMVSHYLPLETDPAVLRQLAVSLWGHAQRWGAKKIRIFAGNRGSATTSIEDRRKIVARLRDVASIAEAHGLSLLAETHPNTLADTGASTLRLIDEVRHPAFKINFDVLHVWEGGDDPVAMHRALRPHIRHYHLKNVASREALDIFEPANVYSAAGRRESMTPLFGGAFDYSRLLTELAGEMTADASLEWFGADCFNTLSRDRSEFAGAMADAARRRDGGLAKRSVA